MKNIGDILRKSREKKHMTMEDVYDLTKIHVNFLRALENDNYSVFSSKIHAKGFLKVYCEFLGLNTQEIMALWRREYEKDLDKLEITKFKPHSVLKIPNIITPGYFLLALIIVCVLGFFGYIYYQYNHYSYQPKLEIFYPKEDILVNSDILDITGKTDLDSEIFINNEKIILAPDGSFAFSIKLKEGLNTISIKSRNNLEREVEQVRTIIYRTEKKEIINVVTTSPGVNPADNFDNVPGEINSGSAVGL